MDIKCKKLKRVHLFVLLYQISVSPAVYVAAKIRTCIPIAYSETNWVIQI